MTSIMTPNTRLRRALHRRSTPLISRILRANPSSPSLLRNPDPSDKGNTSLHLAALLGLPDAASLLIAAGHESDGVSRNVDGLTPLMLAASAGPAADDDATAAARVQVARVLLDAGAEVAAPAARDREGRDAFAHAARAGTWAVLQMMLARPPAAELLVQSAALPGVTKLAIPSSPGGGAEAHSLSPTSPGSSPPVTFKTLQRGHANSGSSNAPTSSISSLPPPKMATTGMMPLQQQQTYVPSPGSPHPLLNSRDRDDNTPLHHASAFGHMASVRILVLAGADAHAVNAARWTPLDYAASVPAEVYLRGLVRERDNPTAGVVSGARAAGRASPVPGRASPSLPSLPQIPGAMATGRASPAGRLRGDSWEKRAQIAAGRAVGGVRLVNSDPPGEDDSVGEDATWQSPSRKRS